MVNVVCILTIGPLAYIVVIDCHTQSADYGRVNKCTEAQLLWKFLYNFEMSRPSEQLNFLIN